MENPTPLAELLARLPFDKLRAFVAPRVPGLVWSLPVVEIAAEAARALVDPWFDLVVAFPGMAAEIEATRARCARPAPSPAPQHIHIGAIHGTNVAVGVQGSVSQASNVGLSAQEVGFLLSRSGPVPELVSKLGSDAAPALTAALAECPDRAVRSSLARLAEQYGVRATWDVFVAYASPDRDVATALADAIGAHGVTVFLDHRCIPAGALWGQALQSALLGSRVVVVVLSDDLGTRPYLAHEVDLAVRLAKDQGTTAVPVWKGAIGTAPYGLGAFQSLTLADGLASAAAKVVAEVPAARWRAK